MKTLEMKVTYGDGHQAVARVRPKSIVALERQYDMAVAGAAQELKFEHMAYLAWSSLHFAGGEPRDFDAWLDDVDDVDEVGEPADAAPFGKEASEESSPG